MKDYAEKIKSHIITLKGLDEVACVTFGNVEITNKELLKPNIETYRVREDKFTSYIKIDGEEILFSDLLKYLNKLADFDINDIGENDYVLFDSFDSNQVKICQILSTYNVIKLHNSQRGLWVDLLEGMRYTIAENFDEFYNQVWISKHRLSEREELKEDYKKYNTTDMLVKIENVDSLLHEVAQNEQINETTLPNINKMRGLINEIQEELLK